MHITRPFLNFSNATLSVIVNGEPRSRFHGQGRSARGPKIAFIDSKVINGITQQDAATHKNAVTCNGAAIMVEEKIQNLLQDMIRILASLFFPAHSL